MLVEPGGYENISYDGYDKIEAVRASVLKSFEDEDAIERWIRENNPSDVERLFIPEPSDSDALEFGTMVHERVLERKQPWVVKPNIDRRTKDGKEFYARWEEANVGKTPVTNTGKRITLSRQRLVGCCHSVLKMIQNEYGPGWRDRAQVELTLVWSSDGLLMKCRIDLLIDADVVDIKTLAQWPSGGRFLAHIEKFSYAMPVKHYMNGCEELGVPVNRYRWLFIESVWPFRSRFVDCPDWFLENTPQRLAKCIANFKRLNQFKAPTEVTLEPEQWWMFRHGEEVQLEGVEDYEE